MSKISLDTIAEVLGEEGVDKSKQEKILEHLKDILEKEKEERSENKVKKAKPQLGVILVDEAGEYVSDNIGALIYEIGANDKHNDVLANLTKAAKEFNANTKSGQKNPIKSVTEVFAHVKPKILKANGNIKKRTKEIVRCLVSNNKI